MLTLGFLALWLINRSRLGDVFRSLRQNQDLAASFGINVAKYRVIAYSICCFYGGVGGAFFYRLPAEHLSRRRTRSSIPSTS